jgi:hypothetical protein
LKKLNDCCKEVLSWIEYRDKPEIVSGRELKVIVKSGQLYQCAICNKVLGVCPICGREYSFPIILFIDEGRKGMITLCWKCFNKLNLGLKLEK